MSAGCATSADDLKDQLPGGGSTPVAPSEAEARSLLLRAAGEMPDRFGFEFNAVAPNGTVLLTLRGASDNATGRTYLEVEGDASALGDGEGDAESAAFLRNGFSIYSSPEGSLYLIEGTAFVFPPSEEDDSQSFVPSPDESPLGRFMDGGAFLSAFNESGLDVTSVRLTTHRAQPAVAIGFVSTEGEERTEGTITLLRDPTRIAHVELKRTDGVAATPLDQATFVGEFYYGSEPQTQIPETPRRALGLAYKSDANPFSFQAEEGPTTWTFLNSGGIPVGEVEVVAKGENAGSNDDLDLHAVPTLWAMRLSEGSATHEGVTVTFHDNDGDGLVSMGDTLVIETAEDAQQPNLVLRDIVTDTYVVPGPGALLALLGLLGAATFATRRRAA